MPTTNPPPLPPQHHDDTTATARRPAPPSRTRRPLVRFLVEARDSQRLWSETDAAESAWVGPVDGVHEDHDVDDDPVTTVAAADVDTVVASVGMAWPRYATRAGGRPTCQRWTRRHGLGPPRPSPPPTRSSFFHDPTARPRPRSRGRFLPRVTCRRDGRQDESRVFPFFFFFFFSTYYHSTFAVR